MSAVRLRLVAMIFACFSAVLSPFVAGASPLSDGEKAYRGGNFASAMRILRPLAESGSADAQYYLGMMYAQGKGVQKNTDEAIKWFRLAARKPDVGAMMQLGILYEDRGDDVRAYMWYALANELVDPKSDAAEELDMSVTDLGMGLTKDEIAQANRLIKQCKASGYKNCG